MTSRSSTRLHQIARALLAPAAAVLAAIERVLAESPVRTPDMGGDATTRDLGQAIVDAL